MRMKNAHMSCEEKEQSKLYRIGMFATMNHVTIKALRYYDDQGLLTPAYVDEENGYRYYTLSQMADLQRILALKEAGFTLDNICEMRRGSGTDDFLTKKKAEIIDEIAELTHKLARLESYANRGDVELLNPVRIRKIPETIVATMQTRIESYDDLFDAMPKMGEEMERLGCKCVEPEYCFTHYLESGHQEEQNLIETCQAVTEMQQDSALVKFQVFPEIEVACIFHKGSYDKFSKSYEMIMRYIEDNGYEICGNIREKYIDGIWNKETEEDWLSEIQIPVIKKAYI